MSVVVRDESGQILLLCKGADRYDCIYHYYFFMLNLISFLFLFFIKFADAVKMRFLLNSIIFERLSKQGRMYEHDTQKHLNEYGESGLRTLALAYKKLEEAEYSSWNNEFIKAKTSIGPDRESKLEQVADMIERDLILIGATAVEDKLQRGVSSCLA